MRLLREKCWHGESRWLNIIGRLLCYQNLAPVWARLTPTASVRHWRVFSEGFSRGAFTRDNSSSSCERFSSLTTLRDLCKTCRSNRHDFPVHNLFQSTWKYFEFLQISWGLFVVWLFFFNELGLVWSSKGQGRSDFWGICFYYILAVLFERSFKKHAVQLSGSS